MGYSDIRFIRDDSTGLLGEFFEAAAHSESKVAGKLFADLDAELVEEFVKRLTPLHVSLDDGRFILGRIVRRPLLVPLHVVLSDPRAGPLGGRVTHKPLSKRLDQNHNDNARMQLLPTTVRELGQANRSPQRRTRRHSSSDAGRLQSPARRVQISSRKGGLRFTPLNLPGFGQIASKRRPPFVGSYRTKIVYAKQEPQNLKHTISRSTGFSRKYKYGTGAPASLAGRCPRAAARSCLREVNHAR